MSRRSFAQPMSERDPLVEHETLAAPTALGLRDAFEITQDATLEVIDLRKTARQQISAGLLAADTAGAEHGDAPMPGRIEMARGEILELTETCQSRIDRTLEGAKRDLEGVARVEHQRVGHVDQSVPIRRLDINADLPGRINIGVAECDDLLFQPDLQALKRHRGGLREFQFETIEPAAEQDAVAQLGDEIVNGFGLAGERAVDALMGQQHAALQLEASANRPQRLAQFRKIGKRCELIECGDLVRHDAGLAGGQAMRKLARAADRIAVIPWHALPSAVRMCQTS